MPSLTKIQTGFLEPQGAFELDPGTSSSPGLFFSGNTSTGMFSPSSGVLGFSTGSTQQALTILADGNVGIGRTDPTSKLHVYDNVSNPIIKVESKNISGEGNPQLIITRGNENTLKLEAFPNVEGRISANAANVGFLSFYTGTAGNERLRITPAGNVGIGTDNPSYKLEVYDGVVSSSGYRVQGNYDATTSLPDIGMYSGSASHPEGFGTLLLSSRKSAQRPIIFATSDGTNLQERARITTSGELYIGSVAVAGQGRLFVNDSTASGLTRAHIRNASVTGVAETYFNLDTAKFASVGLESGDLVFRNSSSSTPDERFRIDSNGYIIAGYRYKTTNHLQVLEIPGRFTGSDGNYSGLYFRNSNDSGGSSSSIRAGRSGDNYGTDLSFWTQLYGQGAAGDGAEIVRISSTGNVGIGTTNPSEKLHVVGTIRADADTQNYKLYNIASGGYRGSVDVDGDGFGLTSRYNNNGFINFKTITGGTLTERVRILNSGNVYINGSYYTTSQTVANQGIVFKSDTTISTSEVYPGISWSGNPGALGRARAAITAISTLDNSASDILFLTRYAADATELNVANDTKMRITSGGNVGIGTGSPQAPFGGRALQLGNVSDGRSVLTLASSDRGSIYFADGTSGGSAFVGYIDYVHADDAMYLGTGSTGRFEVNNTRSYAQNGVAGNNSYSANNYGVATSGKWNHFYEADQVQVIRGYVAGGDNYPNCGSAPTKYPIMGVLTGGGGYQSFIHISVWGSHRGIRSSSYIEHHEWVIHHADHISFERLYSNSSTTNSIRWSPWRDDTSTSGEYGAQTSYPWNIRFSVAPRCGAGFQYTYIVRWYHGNFVPHSTRSW